MQRHYPLVFSSAPAATLIQDGGSDVEGPAVNRNTSELVDSDTPLKGEWTRAPSGGAWRICPKYYLAKKQILISGGLQ